MKRLISIVLVLGVIFTMTIINASAAAANVSLSGPTSAESGSTVTFSVQVSSSEGFTGFSANINASSGLVVQSVSGCPSGWLNSSTNNSIAIAGSTSVTSTEIIIKCTVTGNPGETRTLSLSATNSSDANGNDTACATPSKTISIATPKSGENSLSSLTINGYTLSPSFSASVTSYDIGTVPFDVKSVKINATAKDSAATVSVTGNSFAVGDNTIKINVTAANGSVKTYSVKVKREQDPNYVAESDGSLKSLTVSTGTLSPAFDTKTLEYVVYVPFETTKFSAKAEATSKLAKGVEQIEETDLDVGTNEFDVICTAEDDSKTTYKIYVVRMDEFGKVDDLGLPASLIAEKLEKEETVTEPTTETQTNTEKKGVSVVVVIVIAIVCLVVGFAIAALIFGRKPKGPKDPDDYDDYDIEYDNTVVPMEFEDIQSDSGTMPSDVIYEDPSIDEYLTEEKVQTHSPSPTVTPVETPASPKPVIKDIKVTFADLGTENDTYVEPTVAPQQPPKVPEREHVQYIDYNEYIESLDED